MLSDFPIFAMSLVVCHKCEVRHLLPQILCYSKVVRDNVKPMEGMYHLVRLLSRDAGGNEVIHSLSSHMQVAYLNAKLFDTRRIYFVGNFLRHNHLSGRQLAFAIDYWSSGEMEALFLEHEGYLGALGSFLMSGTEEPIGCGGSTPSSTAAKDN